MTNNSMTQATPLFLDIHAIQTLPPSNINRDDTGSPKTAQYGGVKRARVSSQSWKRAIRGYFNDNGALNNVGVRTKEIVKYVASKIVELDSSIEMEDALEKADEILIATGIKKKGDMKVLYFMGSAQAKKLAQATTDGVTDKKGLQEYAKENPDIDIALFGRMVADSTDLNEEAAAQVSHAISTHAAQTEFDFFTAVDDLSSEDNAGAGMLGTVEFNSSTMYRYANISVHELAEKFKNDKTLKDSLALFIEAFAKSMPTGKVNTFANQTLPEALVITLRNDRPVSLVSAFEEPVKSTNGYVAKSVEKLAAEYTKVEKFVNKPLATFYVSLNDYDCLEAVGQKEDSMTALVADFTEKLEELI